MMSAAGFHKTCIFTTALLGISFSITVQAQTLHVGKGAKMIVSSAKSIDEKPSHARVAIDGDVEIEGELQNDGEIQYLGNLYNRGIYHSTGDDIFTSKKEQHVRGNFSAGNYFYNLIAIKRGSKLRFTGNCDIHNLLQLDSAILHSKSPVFLSNPSNTALVSNAQGGDPMNYIQAPFRQSVKSHTGYRLVNGDSLHGAQPVELQTGIIAATGILSSEYSSSAYGTDPGVEACNTRYKLQSGTWYLGLLNAGMPPSGIQLNFYPGGANTFLSAGTNPEAIKNEKTILSDPCTSLNGVYVLHAGSHLAAYNIIAGSAEDLLAKEDKKYKPQQKSRSALVYPYLFGQWVLGPMIYFYQKQLKK